MNDSDFAKSILVKAKKSKERIGESIHLFQAYLSAEGRADPSKYYLARNRLQDGQSLLEEVLNDAKKLLGPRPEYASEKIDESRKKLLLDSRVIIESRTIDGLEAELLADEYLKSFMNSDSVVHYVREAGTYQPTGKRKLQNFKVRMIIDQLAAMRIEARELQQRAGEKIQSK